MALEDTWFFVILASCLMLTLGALLSGLVYLRLHGYGKLFKTEKLMNHFHHCFLFCLSS